jgi:hypothetical protein
MILCAPQPTASVQSFPSSASDIAASSTDLIAETAAMVRFAPISGAQGQTRLARKRTSHCRLPLAGGISAG